MEKKLVAILTLSCFFTCATVVKAEETLQDNNFDLKTDRLNKEQKDEGKTKSFAVEDRLFENEMIQKLEKEKEEEKKQRKEEVDHLFLSGTKKVKELETNELFKVTKDKNMAVKGEEEKVTSSPIPLSPMILLGVVFTLIMFVFYYKRNRGK